MEDESRERAEHGVHEESHGQKMSDFAMHNWHFRCVRQEEHTNETQCHHNHFSSLALSSALWQLPHIVVTALVHPPEL